MRAAVSGYAPPLDPDDLIAVADAAVSLIGGAEAMRSEVLRLAEFDSALPNYGHRVIAELLCEGAIDCILLWNWDDCIERAPVSPERLQAAHSLEDMVALDQPSIAKIHGCATRQSSLLVTTEDLDSPPIWTDETFAERVRGKTVVFVGVGDIADYARRRLRELLGRFPELDVWVVSPGIVEHWDDSQWAQLLPELEPSRKVALTADEFLDELGRRWVRALLDACHQSVAHGAVRTDVAAKLDPLFAALGSRGASEFIRWFRWASSPGSRVGSSTLAWSEAIEVSIGIAVLAAEAGVAVLALTQAALMLGDDRIEVLVARGVQGAASIRQVARQRAEALAGQGAIASSATFLVAGAITGDLNPPVDLDIASNEPDSDDIFDSSEHVALTFVSAIDAVRRAA